MRHPRYIHVAAIAVALICPSAAAATARLERIPGGTLLMGSTPREIDRAVGSFGVGGDRIIPSFRAYLASESPRHRVRIRPFYLQNRLVTVAEFRRFVRATGYRTTAERCDPCAYYYSPRSGWQRRAWLNWRRPGPGWRARDREPVVQVSLHDAQAYAEWRSARKPGSYRLPTESEFEWAAWGNPRWASSSRRPMFYWGNDRRVHLHANYADKRYPVLWRDRKHDDGFKYASPVKSFPPNGYGLYDMAGNVWQWNSTPISIYSTGMRGRNYSMRGCGFVARRAWCRPQTRMSHPPEDSTYDIGFRLVWER